MIAFVFARFLIHLFVIICVAGATVLFLSSLLLLMWSRQPWRVLYGEKTQVRNRGKVSCVAEEGRESGTSRVHRPEEVRQKALPKAGGKR